MILPVISFERLASKCSIQEKKFLAGFDLITDRSLICCS